MIILKEFYWFTCQKSCIGKISICYFFFLCCYTVYIEHFYTLRFRSLSQTVLMVSSLNLVTMPKCIIYSYSAITSSNAQGAPPLYSFLSDPYETWSQYLKAKIGNQVNWHSWITTLELFKILTILVLQGNRHVMFGCVWINFTWFNYTHQNEHP